MTKVNNSLFDKHNNSLYKWVDSQPISYKDYLDIFSSDFKKESELCDYIENNIKNVCIDLFEDEYVSHEREFNIDKVSYYKGSPKRIDFYIITKKHKILCEVKNPTNVYSELTNGMAQMMSYIVTAERNNIEYDRTVIISSKYHGQFLDIRNRFNLPIEFYCVSKSKLLKLM